ncbi:MAG TPA: pyridoxamine 5'-phosphate oxidase family protein [Acidimicrobiales bacterium]
MQLTIDQCWERLTSADHGVLATVHEDRGVDAVPAVFAAVDGNLVIPVDTVKAKSGIRLQRLANLEADDRCALIVDNYESDWSRLWWVRVHGRAAEVPPTDEWLHDLRRRYPAYREPGTIASVLVIRPAVIIGWSAEAG